MTWLPVCSGEEEVEAEGGADDVDAELGIREEGGGPEEEAGPEAKQVSWDEDVQVSQREPVRYLY